MKKILFVCVGNSCRSQMAEGFARRFAKQYGKDVIIESAGTKPADHVDRIAIEVMKEVGIDMPHHRPKMIDVRCLKDFDIVISMGCEASSYCPVLYDEKVVDWQMPDPIGQPIDEYRKTRDMIKKKVNDMMVRL